MMKMVMTSLVLIGGGFNKDCLSRGNMAGQEITAPEDIVYSLWNVGEGW